MLGFARKSCPADSSSNPIATETNFGVNPEVFELIVEPDHVDSLLTILDDRLVQLNWFTILSTKTSASSPFHLCQFYTHVMYNMWSRSFWNKL